MTIIEIIVLLLTGAAIGEIARWIWTQGYRFQAVAFSAWALFLLVLLSP